MPTYAAGHEIPEAGMHSALRSRCAQWLLAVLLLALSLAREAAAQTYLLTDLGTFGGKSSSANALNSAGVVAGYAALPAGNWHTVVLSNTVPSDLGTLGGSNSVALGLNASGQVVGWANSEGSEAQQAFLYGGGVLTNLGALLNDSTNSVARAINNGGTVVGEYQTGNGHQRPFVYANGLAIDLGFDGAANSINDAGQIVGYERAGVGKLGFILTGAQRLYVGTFGSNDTEVVDINTNGVAAGFSLTVNGTYHAFGYQSGGLRDLGTLGGPSSYANGINNSGHIVGQAQDGQGDFKAFLYRSGVMTDLNTFLVPGLGWVLTNAYAINDTGQIVGVGLVKGEAHGFLLTPNFLDLALYPGLAISGKIGRSYRIEYRDGLSPTNSWLPLTNLVLPSNPYLFIDPRPVVFANRVYRSVLLP
jgi:probable HAF family extracellular repeat protein